MPERQPAVPTIDQPDTAAPDKKSGLDLSPVQVAGGALAAMTAAGLGSRLGAEGTLIGAALASVVAAVAGALYTASLRRTTAVVRGVVGGRRTRPVTEARSAPEPTGSTAAGGVQSKPARNRRRRTLILSSVVGAVAIFALTGVALTLYEAIAGRALSGGDGTTISQVQQGGSADRPTEKEPVGPTESAEPSESADPSPSPTAESSETPELDPAPTAEPSPEPSVEPSADPSATTEPEPSAEAEPSTEASSEDAPTPR